MRCACTFDHLERHRFTFSFPFLHFHSIFFLRFAKGWNIFHTLRDTHTWRRPIRKSAFIFIKYYYVWINSFFFRHRHIIWSQSFEKSFHHHVFTCEFQSICICLVNWWHCHHRCRRSLQTATIRSSTSCECVAVAIVCIRNFSILFLRA